ncbi:MAG TPA: SRPBCC family protein [Micromonosporaceae bacterium]|jgi:carbon monoxide dehydrogenase subunit G
MISIERRITVPSPPEDVWRVMSDPVSVVRCVPGATLDSQEGETFAGKITVAFGAMRVPFRGTGSLALDPDARSGTLTGQGRDFNGGTRFSATAGFTVADDAEGAAVTLTGTVTLAGKLATLIEAGASAVVESMLAEFATNLAAVTAPPDDEPSAATAAPPPAAPARIPARVWLRSILAALGSLLRIRRRAHDPDAG